VLSEASTGFWSPSPNSSPTGDFDRGGAASIQPRIHQGNGRAQLRVRLWKIFGVPQDSVCRPARHQNSEPSLKGHFRNACAIRKT
jgi:hypothetical protein